MKSGIRLYFAGFAWRDLLWYLGNPPRPWPPLPPTMAAPRKLAAPRNWNQWLRPDGYVEFQQTATGWKAVGSDNRREPTKVERQVEA